MRRLTDKQRKIIKILMRSLPAAMLAAIAFITIPSLLPMSIDRMSRSVTMIEYTERYEIVAGGKRVAVAAGIESDSTLTLVSRAAGSKTGRTTLTSGVWINKYSFMPSCGGRILAASTGASSLPAEAAAMTDARSIIEKTIAKRKATTDRIERQREEMDYYLSTHDLTDEGYTTIAEHAAANDSMASAIKAELKILEAIKDSRRLTIRKTTSYALLHSPDGKKVQRTPCSIVEEEGEKHAEGTVILQTADGFMPDESCAVYAPWLLKPKPENGDDMIVAAFFGMKEKEFRFSATTKAKVFIGKMTGNDSHDVPPLLSPDGSAVFNSNGYFIGISKGGRTAR